MAIRLNKVTRDLNVGLTTVVEFLQKKGFEVNANPNTQITKEQYDLLVKEFKTDKKLRIESEKISQERQNKDRNKGTVSIDDKKEENAATAHVTVPEDVRPRFKPVGKIDLESLNRKKKNNTAQPAQQQPQPQPVEKVTDAEGKQAVNEVKDSEKADEVKTAPQAEQPQAQPEQN